MLQKQPKPLEIINEVWDNNFVDILFIQKEKFMLKQFLFIMNLGCFITAIILYFYGKQNEFQFWAFLTLFNYITYNSIGG